MTSEGVLSSNSQFGVTEVSQNQPSAVTWKHKMLFFALERSWPEMKI